jgi:hypothetical protein
MLPPCAVGREPRLARAGEWLPVKELGALAQQRGIAQRTLRRAKESLSLQYHREGFASRLLCALPNTEPYSATSPEKDTYADRNPPSAVQGVESQRDGIPVHTRPQDTCPSQMMTPWTSMFHGIPAFRLEARPGPPPFVRLLADDHELARANGRDPDERHIRLALSALARARAPRLEAAIIAFLGLEGA